MIGYLKQLAGRNLVSPYTLAIFSYLVFLFAWVFPPGLYTSYIREPNILFLNVPTLIYYTLCTGGFIFGVWACRFLGVPKPKTTLPVISTASPLIYLAGPLVLGSILCAIFLIKLGGHINFVALLASQQGDSIKLAGNAGALTEGGWASSLTALTIIIWWAAYRSLQLQLKGTTKLLFYAIFAGSTFVAMLTCVATVDRTSLMPIISGLLIVYLFGKTRGENVKISKLLFTIFGSGIGILGVFLTLSFLRGAQGAKQLTMSFMGYTIVSYNRMAAVVTHVMHYGYEGRGAYLFPFLVKDDRFNDIIPLRYWFGWPYGFIQWRGEFDSVMMAGLNPGFNWSGYFGYLFSDIGWWSPLYMAGVGVIAGYFWSRFCAGKCLGIISYLWVAFSILFWIGYNWLFREQLVRFIFVAAFLMIYDRVFIRQMEGAPVVQLRPAPLRERVI